MASFERLRGNSKYHYYGIRVKPTSSLNQMSVEDSPPGVQHQRQQNGGKRGNNKSGSGNSGTGGPGSAGGGGGSSGGGGGGGGSLNSSLTHQQYLGDAAAALPQWPDLEADSSQLPPGIGIDDLQAFVTLYRDHCEVFSQDLHLMNCVNNFSRLFGRPCWML